MTLRRLKVTNVRCVADAELVLHPARNYIYGTNGAGKTTVLEAIFLLGRGRSFRTRQIRRLVRHGATSLAVYGEVEQPARERRVGIAFRDGRLEKKIDGEPAPGSAALVEVLPLHTIDPSVHELIQGGPSERRRYLDWGVFHVEHSYLDAWRRFRRVLGQRNSALKAGARPPELGAWTAALAEAGRAVDASRDAYLERLRAPLAEYGVALLGRPIAIRYDRGWSTDLDYTAALRESESRDRSLANTELGPHRADLGIRLDDEPLQGLASRGQQKLAASALVLAQARLFAESRGPSTLLVDDPAAELDDSALARLLAALDGVGAQLVLTGLSRSQLAPAAESGVFHVERGEVRGL